MPSLQNLITRRTGDEAANIHVEASVSKGDDFEDDYLYGYNNLWFGS